MPCSTAAHGAAGPESGPQLPSLIVSAVTPGVPLGVAGAGPADAAALPMPCPASRFWQPIPVTPKVARSSVMSLRRMLLLTRHLLLIPRTLPRRARPAADP